MKNVLLSPGLRCLSLGFESPVESMWWLHDWKILERSIRLSYTRILEAMCRMLQSSNQRRRLTPSLPVTMKGYFLSQIHGW